MNAQQPTAQSSIKQLFDLSGQVAIVTGGGAGIGQAIAFRIAEAGAAVLVADMNLETAQQTAELIVEQGGRAQACKVDISQVAEARAMVQTAVQTFGRLDILVNNAGIFPFAPALEVPEQLWDHVLDVNLKGTFFSAQAAAQQMAKAGTGGRIVNIASIDALHPTGFLVHYDSSKGGVLMLTKALAKEWGQYGVTVNAIAPGSIMTPGAAAATAGTQPAASQQPEADMVSAFMARIPLGRMGAPDDIATAALFLASKAASYMTGSLMVVDGGYLLS